MIVHAIPFSASRLYPFLYLCTYLLVLVGPYVIYKITEFNETRFTYKLRDNIVTDTQK